MSESLVNWCGGKDALVHYSTTRSLLVPPIVRTSLIDYNSVKLVLIVGGTSRRSSSEDRHQCIFTSTPVN